MHGELVTKIPIRTNKQSGDEKLKKFANGKVKTELKAGRLKIQPCEVCGESEYIILKDIDESTRIRLQLQHNDIHGEPDEFLVQELKKSLLEEDLKLVTKGLSEIIKDDQKIKYDEPIYSYVHICLMPESEKEFTQLLDALATEENQKYLLEKEEYNQLKKCLTLAFQRGYKTPGKAIRRILDIYQQNENQE